MTKLQRQQQIAQLAARLYAEENLPNYSLAKQRACRQLGYSDRQGLPNHQAIHQALLEYLAIFQPEQQQQRILALRQTACQAMQFLQAFEPRLVGSVLHGTANGESAVHLHVFAEPVETILQFLMDKNINYQLSSYPVKYQRHRASEMVTACEFLAANVPIKLSLFERESLSQAPLSPINGKPMQRMKLSGLLALIKQESKIVA